MKLVCWKATRLVTFRTFHACRCFSEELLGYARLQPSGLEAPAYAYLPQHTASGSYLGDRLRGYAGGGTWKLAPSRPVSASSRSVSIIQAVATWASKQAFVQVAISASAAALSYHPGGKKKQTLIILNSTIPATFAWMFDKAAAASFLAPRRLRHGTLSDSGDSIRASYRACMDVLDQLVSHQKFKIWQEKSLAVQV